MKFISTKIYIYSCSHDPGKFFTDFADENYHETLELSDQLPVRTEFID